MMNDNIRSILEDAYQHAESPDDTEFALSESQQRWVEIIVEKAESQKAVLAVLITSLTKKIETPTQDVRYHKKELPNGYSGRVFDTQHITPFIREKFQRFAMKGGSGWLTRSLEQAHPYTLEYPGRILDRTVKEAFLQVLNDIEENQDAHQKFSETSVSRYYLLTTAEPNVDDSSTVDLLVQKIYRQHRCEVIVNGIPPSLKYYLRLLSNPKLFLDFYSKNLQLDFNENTDVKEIHLRRWNELLESLL